MTQKFSTGIDLLGFRVVGLGDGTNPTDAVTVQQLQAFVQGAAWKLAARAASTGNVSLTAPGATLDGVTLATNDRVLLKDQTAGAENGIYVWTGSGATLTRASDADTSAKLKSATVQVAEGTVNADKAFTQTADNVTVGTTALVWAPFGGGTSYTQGNGITISAGAIAVLADPVTGGGILVTSSGVKVNPSVVTRKYATTVGNGSATSFTVTHNLGTTDIGKVTFRALSAFNGIAVGERFEAEDVVVDANSITVTFGSAPPSNGVRVIVQG